MIYLIYCLTIWISTQYNVSSWCSEIRLCTTNSIQFIELVCIGYTMHTNLSFRLWKDSRRPYWFETCQKQRIKLLISSPSHYQKRSFSSLEENLVFMILMCLRGSVEDQAQYNNRHIGIWTLYLYFKYTIELIIMICIIYYYTINILACNA